MKQIKEEYNIKEKNIMGKWKDLKKSSTVILNYMDITCDLFEKIKNLIKWEEPRMSKLFLALSIVLMLIVTFIPLRIIIIFYLPYKFYLGRRYHTRRLRNNKEVISIEFGHFLDENKIKLTSLDDPWEKCVPKNAPIKIFEQKLSFYF